LKSWRPTPALAVLLAAALGAGPTRADKILLRNGGVLLADHWWIEKDTIYYESPAGSVGIPRSAVAEIVPSLAPDRTWPATDTRPASPVPPRPEPSPLPATANAHAREGVSEGMTAFARRDFESAASWFDRAIASDPQSSASRVGYALSQMALGRDERALAVVLEGLARDPGSADLHELLGDLRDGEERVEDALTEWREAFRLAPNDRLREKIFKAERELDAARDYAFSAAAHFNIRYDGQIHGGLAVQIAEQLEASYHELSGEFRHSPPRPITVLLYPETQFRDVTQAPDNVAGLYDGKIRVPLGGMRRLDEPARRVLVHELTHAVVHSKTRGNCPRWLHEGLAQRSEPHTLSAADLRGVRKLLQSQDPASWDAEAFSYPAALSLTQYLESLRGFEGLVQVLDRLGEGMDIDPALELIYGQEYAALCERWAETLLGEARQ